MYFEKPDGTKINLEAIMQEKTEDLRKEVTKKQKEPKGDELNRPYLTEQDLIDIRTKYRDLSPKQHNGDSIGLLAELYACTKADIREIVASTKTFPTDIKPRKERVQITGKELQERIEKIREMALLDMSDQAIARTLNCTAGFVNRHRKIMGLPSSYTPYKIGHETRQKMRAKEKTNGKRKEL